MNKLLRYLKDYRKESILGPLFKLLEASFELLVPLVVAAIIDRGIGGADKGYTVKMCLLLLALGVVGLISSVTAQYFAAKAAVGFAEKVRHALFGHIQRLSYSDIDSLGTSTLVTRMTSDMNQVQYGVNMTLRLLLRSPFVVFGAMIMAFTVDAKAALTFVVTIPLLSVVVFGIMLICIPLYRRVQERLDSVLLATACLIPTLSHITALPLYQLNPMLLVLLAGMLFVPSRANTMLLALLLPTVSMLAVGMPTPLKAVCMVAEMLTIVSLFSPSIYGSLFL